MPTTIADLIARQRAAVDNAVAQWTSARGALDSLRTELGSVSTLTPEQDQRIRSAIESKDGAATAVRSARAELERLEAEERSDAELDRIAEQRTPGASRPAYDQVARTGAEPHTYTRETCRQGVSFIRDLVRSYHPASGAERDRLARHMTEARVDSPDMLQRDVGTGAFAGLTVPQYLTDLVAPAVAKGRPLADNCRKLDLPPDGMVIDISRVTTATSAAVQATENAGVSETDIDDTLLAVNVRTIAGQQDVSRQVIDRSVNADQVVIEDLVRRYHTALDNSIINDDGTSGTHLGIRSTTSIIAVTYTDATPTPSEAWGPLWDLQQQIESGVYAAASHLVMHPRRWAFFCSAIGTNQAMLGQMGVAPLLLGEEQSKAYGAGVRGILAGLPVIVDANIPTTISSTQDTILAVTDNELFLWEQPGSPLLIRAEEVGVGTLTVKLVVYGYSAFTAGRYPGAHGAITGTGLTTPTFGIAAS